MIRLMTAAALFVTLGAGASSAADLQPGTAAAFERYATLTEARLDGESGARYLWVETLPEPRRREALAALRRGELVIEPMETRDRGREVDVPDGLIHHWLGVVFVPGATLDRRSRCSRPTTATPRSTHRRWPRSKLRARSGDTFTVYLRFMMKKVITVVDQQRDTRRASRATAPDRVQSRIRSTRIAEVEDPGTPQEREKPVGRDGGYLWRLNSLLALPRARRRRLRPVRIDHADARHPDGVRLAGAPVRDEHPARVAHLHARDDARAPDAALNGVAVAPDGAQQCDRPRRRPRRRRSACAARRRSRRDRGRPSRCR